MAQVLLADPCLVRRSSLGRQLADNGFSVNAVSHGLQVLQAIQVSRSDLALIASDLPGPTANQICETLRDAQNAIPVVQLLAVDGRDARVTALKAGADYALPYSIALDELLASMQAVLRRSLQVQQHHLPTDERGGIELRYKDLVVHLDYPGAKRNDREIRLTAKEHELLLHLIRNKGQVCERAHILADVWGRSWRATDNLLDVYVGYLRKKLDFPGSQAMLRTIRGVGFILE